MIMDPSHPIFASRYGPPHTGMPPQGFLPPGAVPPGARFDPITGPVGPGNGLRGGTARDPRGRQLGPRSE